MIKVLRVIQLGTVFCVASAGYSTIAKHNLYMLPVIPLNIATFIYSEVLVRKSKGTE